MNKSEAYRILGSYQAQKDLHEWVQENDAWEWSFDKTKECYGNWIDPILWKNVIRSKREPSVPKVKNPRLPLNKVCDQFCELLYDDDKIILENFALLDERVTIEFRIPQELQASHADYSKITRPLLQYRNGIIEFGFTYQEEPSIKEEVNLESTVNFDIGKNKIFSGSRTWSNGGYSAELVPSKHTMNHVKRIKKLETEYAKVRRKNAARAKLGVSNAGAIQQELELAQKLKNTKREADWSSATDMLNHSLPNETIIIEQLNWNTGGSRFRSSVLQKLDHKARLQGKNTKRVNPAYTSQDCPKCETRIGRVKNTRLFTCTHCEWSENTDYSASLNMGKKANKKKLVLTARKGKPTPKRPKKPHKQEPTLPKKKVAWTTFTGVNPTVTKDWKQIASTSAVTATPYPLNTKLKE